MINNLGRLKNMAIKVDTATLQAQAAALRKPRHKTREIRVGDKIVGGDNPIWVQSMTTPDTYKIEETVAEILRLEEAGCEIVRVTVPKAQDAAVLGDIRKRIHIPLICDIHLVGQRSGTDPAGWHRRHHPH
jgi:(E)-4-hydroxy-3-methylbut-2-enyl-diphosphate synthase